MLRLAFPVYTQIIFHGIYMTGSSKIVVKFVVHSLVAFLINFFGNYSTILMKNDYTFYCPIARLIYRLAKFIVTLHCNCGVSGLDFRF